MSTHQLRTLEGCVRPSELADRMGVDPSTLDDWRKRRGLPSFKVAGRRYYRLSAVDQWLRKQEQSE
jgi:DNA-binding transcriptional MerR regulator